MPADDVERFEAVAGDLLEELGYPLGAQSLSSEALEHAARMRSLFDWHPVPQHCQDQSAGCKDQRQGRKRDDKARKAD